MLTLTRHEGDEVLLTLPDGRRIRLITFRLERRGGVPRVRLGIEAPPDVKIVRGEIDKPAVAD